MIAKIYSNVEIQKLDPNKYFTVMLLAPNDSINIDTFRALNYISKTLGKQLQLCVHVKTGLPSARGSCLAIAKMYYYD